jgi:hypothetical protein
LDQLDYAGLKTFQIPMFSAVIAMRMLVLIAVAPENAD